MSTEMVSVAVIDLGDYSRLDQRHVSQFAAEKLSGQPLATRMARRLSASILIDQVFVVGSNIPTDVLTSGISGAETINMPSCHGCERLAAVVDRTKSEWIVTAPCNRPFIDADLVDQLLARALKTKECDYVGYVSQSGDETLPQKLGLVAEACHGDTLRRLRRYASQLADDSTAIPQWLGSAPGAYHLKFVSLPTSLDRNDLRFLVEDESDWLNMEHLCETVRDFEAPWSEITESTILNDRLRQSMLQRNL